MQRMSGPRRFVEKEKMDRCTRYARKSFLWTSLGWLLLTNFFAWNYVGLSVSSQRILTSLDDEMWQNGLGGQSYNTTFEKDEKNPFLNRHTSAFEDHLYDAIVIGGGGTGCPFARTLAEVGLRVLLIERGGSRMENSLTLDTHGVGKGLNDPSIAQLLVTSEGVRSHVGHVLSGGTALNIGIFIFETDEYLDLLESIPGVMIHRDLFHQAMNWTAQRLASRPSSVEPLFYENIWQKSLESIIGPLINESSTLHVNRTWQSFSIFNQSNHGYRKASDSTLGPPQHDFPKTLDVLLHHTVEKIELNKKRATCVIIQPTSYDQSTPLVSSKLRNSTTFLHRFLDNIHLLNRFNTPKTSFHSAAVKKSTLLTPLLLFKSGIGSAEDVRKAGAELLHEEPQLGRNLKDRLFVPFSIFSANKSGDNADYGSFQPRVNHAVGLTSLVQYSAWENSTTTLSSNHSQEARRKSTTHLAFEILSGSNASTGIMLATRYVIPPELRHTLIADLFFSTLERCDRLEKPFEGKLSDSGCAVLWPILQCMRRSISGYVFPGEVNSHGFITFEKDGSPYVEAGYLKDPADGEALVQGIRLLNEIVTKLHDKGSLLELASPHSCPSIIFNTLIQFVETQFLKKQSMEHFDKSSPNRTLVMLEAQQLVNWSHRYLKSFVPYPVAESPKTRWSFMTGFFRSLFQLPWSLKTKKKTYPATFPITSPVVDQEASIKEWTHAFSTSLWHWIGSAGIGIVTDNEFKMKGLDNLLIVDASVLTNMTRMNPMATLISLARYAGVITRNRLVGSMA